MQSVELSRTGIAGFSLVPPLSPLFINSIMYFRFIMNGNGVRPRDEKNAKRVKGEQHKVSSHLFYIIIYLSLSQFSEADIR